MTKYHLSEVNKIVKGYAVKYNKGVCHVRSLWYFNDDRTELFICTNLPGVWIGKAGKDVEQLKEDLNKVITDRNERLQKSYDEGRINFKPDIVPQIVVKFIECNF